MILPGFVALFEGGICTAPSITFTIKVIPRQKIGWICITPRIIYSKAYLIRTSTSTPIISRTSGITDSQR